jgi:hypothetical protein
MATSDQKAGSIAGSRKFEPPKRQRSGFIYAENPRVCRKPTGAITPEFSWLLYAAIEMAPSRRKFTPGQGDKK